MNNALKGALAALVLTLSAHAAVVVEYHFDGDAMDTSGNMEHGTLMGGATFGPGRFGQALLLDGINDFVHVPIGNYVLANFTLECWINVPTYSDNLHYISLYQNSYLVLGDYAGNLMTSWADGLIPVRTEDAAPFPSLSTWTHIAFTFNGVDQKLYVDGVEVNSVPSTGAVTQSTSSFNTGLNIGARHTGGTQFVDGLLDNVRIHDTALAPMDLGFFRDGTQVEIRTVTTIPTQVAPGQTGIAVSFDAENIGMSAVDITAADLIFLDAMAMDLSPEYTVTPDPANPIAILPGATEVFNFTVDVSPPATLGTITIEGSIDATDPMTMATSMDRTADTPDSWDVIGAVVMLRTVDSPDATVAQGGMGYQVTVTAENTGLNSFAISGAGLTFTGTVDRTAEYTVTPDPANPTAIAPGATEALVFSVDVDVMASLETITLDGVVSGADTVSGGMVQDTGADVTDTWMVLMCAATICGDCNGDGVVSILDALTAAQHSAGLTMLTGVAFTNCNVIGAVEPSPLAMVDVLDALTLAQAAAGLPVMLICC